MTLGGLRRDLRHALRLAVRSPGLTLSALLMLGIALAAATVVFGMVDAVLLRPLPFHAPDRLVAIWDQPDTPGAPVVEVAFPQTRLWRMHSRSLAGLALINANAGEITLTEGGEPLRLPRREVSDDFFALLGVGAAVGRTFTPGVDDRVDRHVVMLGNSLWRRRFGADPGIAGRRIHLDGVLFEVIGVLPAHLPFPRGADLWFPLAPILQDPVARNIRLFEAVGRLHPGVSVEQAAAELTALSRGPLHTGEHHYPARLTLLTGEFLGGSPAALHLMAAAVGLLLLVACANVSALLLARAVVRQREMALRAALGAGQGRLIRQLLAENFLLAGLAAALALPLAAAGLRLAASLGQPDIPRLEMAALDGRAVAFVLTAALLGLALFGLVPAFETVSRDMAAALREGERLSAGLHAGRLRSLLVAGEAALALVVLLLAGLTARSFVALRQADLGFDPAGRLAFHLEIPSNLAAPERQALLRQVVQRMEQVPGVKRASLILKRPLSGSNGWDYQVVSEGQVSREAAANPIFNYEEVSPGYFHNLGIPLLRGRDFAWTDVPRSPPVVVVSRSAAERLWPAQDPLGKRLRWRDDPERPPATVVGVVEDVRYREIEDARSDIYAGFAQHVIFSETDIVLRTDARPEKIQGAARAALRALDPRVVMDDAVPLERAVSEAVAQPRLRTLVLGSFAALAVLLAGIGVYGSVAWSVAQRRREIAIRLALGAERSAVLRLVLGRTLAAVTLGTAAGLLAFAAVLAQPRAAAWLAGLLYQVPPADLPTLLAAPLALLGVAFAASLRPVLRALRDPAAALRAE